MTRMFEKIKEEIDSSSLDDSESKLENKAKIDEEFRAPLKILVKAIGRFGPIYEYFNLLLKPLAEMLQRSGFFKMPQSRVFRFPVNNPTFAANYPFLKTTLPFFLSRTSKKLSKRITISFKR